MAGKWTQYGKKDFTLTSEGGYLAELTIIRYHSITKKTLLICVYRDWGGSYPCKVGSREFRGKYKEMNSSEWEATWLPKSNSAAQEAFEASVDYKPWDETLTPQDYYRAGYEAALNASASN
tara:strand:+ start:584 stop:946 length:363 start_codon:yes stop_codon:yes gene_type:complete